MRIIVNALPLQGLLTGISRYVRCLYTALSGSPDTATAFFNGATAADTMPSQADWRSWAKATERIWRLPDIVVAGARGVHWLNYERRLRASCRRTKYDVYHETGFVPPALREVPVVYTLYDISLIKYRKEHPRERVQFFDFFFKRRRCYADRVLTISEFMRSELIENLGFEPDRVTAVPLAADPLFRPRTRDQASAVRSALGIPEDYILCVGTLEPRKNIALVINALSRSKTDIPLVLTGWQGWGDKSWLHAAERVGMGKRVFVTGYITDEQLSCLYSGARALVYPSLYEGFGLPVLEAMACGCPVICSRASSLPEVAGDAAVLIDPHDPDECAQWVDKVVCDTAYTGAMRTKGLSRAAEFDWSRTARQTLEVFRQAACS